MESPAGSNSHDDEAQRIKTLREGLDYATMFEAAGMSYSEADADGLTVIHSCREGLAQT